MRNWKHNLWASGIAALLFATLEASSELSMRDSSRIAPRLAIEGGVIILIICFAGILSALTLVRLFRQLT
jgi:hypothetical protein